VVEFESSIENLLKICIYQKNSYQNKRIRQKQRNRTAI